MNGVFVVWTGKRGEPAWEELVAEYKRRVARYVPAAELRLRPAVGRAGDPARVLAQEAQAVSRHLAAGDILVVLDERGREFDSLELAHWLGERWQRARVVLVLGSDLGVDATLSTQAALRLSLSRLTLPHLLARLLVWEQLFRAADTLAGGSYHRGLAGKPETSSALLRRYNVAKGASKRTL